RQASANRINTEGKQLIEGGMETFQSECALAQQIPVKCLDVAQVENDAMALGDRPLVVRIVAQNLEQFIARISRVCQSQLIFVASTNCSGECSHDKSLPLMLLPREGCTENSGAGEAG